jgi:hypothetical protein
MSTLTFDSNEDSIAEARLLVEALTDWLADQPPTPASGRAQFCYRPDGTLDSILTAPVSD